MTHAGEEFALGSIGMICRLAGSLQRPLLPHLLTLALRHILSHIDDMLCLSLRIRLSHHFATYYVDLENQLLRSVTQLGDVEKVLGEQDGFFRRYWQISSE